MFHVMIFVMGGANSSLSTQICQIYLFAYEQCGVGMWKTKECSQNVYQMAIVEPGFGFICETDGVKVLLEETFSQHNSNM